ncbi:ABC1 kinase family protein [Caenispirillum bisanense]|uniref:Predicted unusual protein kinase regulating ubiquinone biosynthesis, AarF/ABC1/UbiB family n=1 Tax=Caenispirillum bisanense TaxID=414052 RepID=A0A286GMV4_9PROT|nr:AarF/ABC1/UbiB kinase family protein [Caenispirillum bisanense]SOD96822.1 Predicted unusual protein kinase regulating ubiquinone biosynthesis, AarF/ABC1/UbiB family [Caenispirillum bisanense]
MADIPQDRSERRFGGRIRRYAEVGTAVSGLAARLAGERFLGLKIDKAQHASELRAALGGLKGPLMKVAQIMSTIPEALPEEYTLELAQLQANAPHMGWPFVKRRMTAELGPDWPRRFADFGHEAAAAASLGQVHKATHHDGRRLACKLQYPDMDSVVEADLRQLRIIIGIYRRYDRAIDPSDIHAEIAERLREELDYRREARNMRLYELMLRDEPDIHVPEPVDDLSSRRLLTMTWLDGRPLLKVAEEADQERRNRIAQNMFTAWYVPFYRYGVIHGDPHLGNYTVRADDGINLLDFGAVRVFRPPFVKGVIDLYRAIRDDDEALAVDAYETWGFTDLSKEKIAVLNQWAAFVYAPLLEDKPRAIAETNSGVYGRTVAEKVHADLRRLGGVRPPREFVLMDRAAIGLGSVFLHLKAHINWYQIFHRLIGDFDAEALAERQRKALDSVGLTVAEDKATVPKG